MQMHRAATAGRIMAVSLNKTKTACRIGDEKTMIVPAARVNGRPLQADWRDSEPIRSNHPGQPQRAHDVALAAADKVLGLKDSETVRGLPTPVGAPRQLHPCRDDSKEARSTLIWRDGAVRIAGRVIPAILDPAGAWRSDTLKTKTKYYHPSRHPRP
jgi:hypothetical protein